MYIQIFSLSRKTLDKARLRPRPVRAVTRNEIIVLIASEKGNFSTRETTMVKPIIILYYCGVPQLILPVDGSSQGLLRPVHG